jgi:DNA modification methylase
MEVAMAQHQTQPVVLERVNLNVPIKRIRINPQNARTHSRKQVRDIAACMKACGFGAPLLVDENLMLIAGHGRLKAAEEVGFEEVPVVQLRGLTDAQKRALALADNKLALNAGWDEDLLATELEALQNLDLDFDLSLTGFSITEVDELIEAQSHEEPGDPKDDRLPPEDGPPLCRSGDIWELGPHRLISGNALCPETVAALVQGERAQMVFTDPPYNVPIKGHVSTGGTIQHREFAMASGEMSSAQFTSFLKSAFINLTAHSHDGAIHLICMDWRHIREVLDGSDGVYSELKTLIVWSKDNGGMGTFYRSRHELIFAFKCGTGSHLNNFELGQHGRYRTNVWEYRGANTFKSERLQELALHPTVKPVQMIADAIKDLSARGSIVLDLFGGSGSTLIAAHKTRRRAFLCEIDPLYCDRIIRRWESYAKDQAVQVACGVGGHADQEYTK